MQRKNIIILNKDEQFEAWGSFTELCEAHGFPYHSLKSKKYPFEFDGWKFVKVPFRSKNEN